MPKQTVVQSAEVIAQGAVLELSTDDGVTFVTVPGIETVPRIGSEGTFVEVQSIDELTKRYIAGLKTPPEWELPFRRIGDSAPQDALIAAAQAGGTVKIKVTYQTGDVADIDLVLNGYFAEEAAQGDAPQLFAVKGQQSGDAAFTKVA